MFQERLSTLAFGTLKVTNLGKEIVMNSLLMLIWIRQDKTFLPVYCAMFSLTWFDDCSILFLYMYFNNDSVSEIIYSSLVATVGIGELNPYKFKYETV